jgi:hypothetical protein
MRLRGFVVVAAGLAALGLPTSASAADVTLETGGTQPFERRLVALAGERVGAVARVSGALPGSTLTLSFVHRGRTLRTVRQPVIGAGEARGSAVPPPGALAVRAQLAPPNGGPSASGDSAATAVSVMEAGSRAGARGVRVRWLQRRLAALGYAVRLTGVHDAHTSNAVIAYRKVLRVARVGTASAAVFRAAMAGRGAYAVRFPRAGRHVEADLTRQVLALVEPGGKVVRVYHTSSGRPRFKTPLGVYRFWRKERGLNSRKMLHTAYFTRAKETKPTRPACGIHGYFAVPVYAYSHCCLRVPLADAFAIFRWARLGERIYVYRS